MTGPSNKHLDEASWLRLERAPGETLRAALERALRGAIHEGSLRAGVRLPSSRRLAEQVGVSRGVTSDVYAQLEAQGFISLSPRRAPVVAPVAQVVRRVGQASAAPAALRHDLSPTTPDVTLFPVREWVAALGHAARRAPARLLDYGDPRGERGLRETLAGHLGRTRGVVADPDQIVVVQGTAQGVDLLLRLLRSGGAGRIAVEDPSLEGVHRRVAALGLETVGCPVDDRGVRMDGVRAAAAIVTPAHQFPTGVVLGGGRRRALLDWARAGDALVVEDDYDAEFRYDRDPVRALQGLDPERVAYIGTVSKTLAPALRLGWLVVPDGLAAAAAEEKRLLDFSSPVLDQLALRRLLESGQYDRHVRRVRAVYRARRDRLREALARHLPQLAVQGVAAGLHVLVELPAGWNDQAIADAAIRAGIGVEPLSGYSLSTSRPPGLVIGYGRVHESAVEPAIAALATVIRSHAPGDR